MTELSAINVKITGDSKELKAALMAAEKAINDLGSSAKIVETQTQKYKKNIDQLSSSLIKNTEEHKKHSNATDQAANSLLRAGNVASAAANKTTQSFAGLGQMSKSTRGAIQNVGYQLQDIVVQLQMGTNASRVLAQQLPQMAQSFGAFGAIIGAGIGLAIPAISLLFTSMEEGADNVSEALGEASSAINAMNQAASQSRDIEELTIKYGDLASEAQRAFRAIAELSETKAKRSLTSALAGVTKEYGELISVVTQLANLREDDDFASQQAASHLRDRLKAISSELGISTEKAEVFVNELEGLKNAKGLDQQVDAVELLRRTIDWAFTKDIPNSISQLEAALIEAGPILIDLKYREIDPEFEAREIRKNAERNAQKDSIKKGRAGPPDLFGVSEMNEQIATLKDALRTQKEVIAEAFVKRQLIIGNAVQKEVLTYQEANEMSLRSEREFLKEMEALEAKYLNKRKTKKEKPEFQGPEAPEDLSRDTAALGALRDALATEEEAIAGSFVKRQTMLGEFLQRKWITEQEAYQLSLRSEQQFREQMAALQQNQYAAAYEQQGQALLTETERVSVWYAEQLELLMNYYNARGELDEGYYTRLEDLTAEHERRMQAIEDAKQAAKTQAIRGFFGNILTMTQGNNKKLFELTKAAAIAEATVSGISSAIKAWEAGMSTGGPHAPFVAAAYAAASLARTGAMISQLKSASFSGGGSGGGGGGSAVAAPSVPATSNRVALQLVGGDMFSRDQVIKLINAINEAQEDGAVVRLV